MRLDPNKCKKKMAENCLDVSRLSEATGLSFKTISTAVRGMTEPHAKNVKKICEALKCEPAEILED